MDIIAKVVPIFVLLIFVEAGVGLVRRRQYYRLNDTITDLSTGLLFSMAGVFIVLVTLAAYTFIQSNWSLQILFGFPSLIDSAPVSLIPEAPFLAIHGAALLTWLVVLIVVDFIYYWFHRACHEVNFLWGCHVTHHSSEEFNLSVALRQCSFQRVFEYMFYLPLALFGVPFVMFFVCHGLLKIYQFWVHTRHIGLLGPFEKFMLTPSHHRVHHARDPKYIDRNHGGILVIWDRLFGSFAEEEEEPHYGLAKPLTTFNPLWGTVHVYADMFRDMLHTPRWADRLRLMYKPPGWRPPELGGPVVAQEVAPDYQKHDPQIPSSFRAYAFVQFLLLTGLALVVLRLGKSGDFPLSYVAVLALFATAGLTAVGGLLDGRRWGTELDAGRHVATILASAVLFYFGEYTQFAGISAAVSGASLVWLTALLRSGRSYQAAV